MIATFSGKLISHAVINAEDGINRYWIDGEILKKKDKRPIGIQFFIAITILPLPILDVNPPRVEFPVSTTVRSNIIDRNQYNLTLRGPGAGL